MKNEIRYVKPVKRPKVGLQKRTYFPDNRFNQDQLDSLLAEYEEDDDTEESVPRKILNAVRDFLFCAMCSWPIIGLIAYFQMPDEAWVVFCFISFVALAVPNFVLALLCDPGYYDEDKMTKIERAYTMKVERFSDSRLPEFGTRQDTKTREMVDRDIRA